jgi:hypothetical protein
MTIRTAEARDASTDPGSFDSLLNEIAGAPPIALDSVTATLVPGTVVDGQFEVIERLGAGGMGVVYLARDLRLGREVALKVMRLDPWRPRRDRHQALQAVFEREAIATARLNHTNVVTLHQFGSWDGAFYLVLERLRGRTLAARLAAGRVRLGEALDITEQVLRGLAHAHGLGIIHRDLKPQNVFLTDDGSVKVLDFGLAGLARAGDDDAAPGMALGTLLSRAGTPAYMAPEQRRGGPQDARADIWAAGVMLFQLVTGGLPAASSHRPASRVPRALDALLRRALDHDPARRPADAAEMLQSLQKVRDELAGRTRRRRILAAAGVAIALVAAGVATVRVATGPRDPELAGTWAYAPEGRAGVTITRAGPHRFVFDYTDAAPGELASPDRFHIRGELTIERRGGDEVLAGEVIDLPGWGKGQVGIMEFRILDEDRLMMTRSQWGKNRDQYTFSYPPWLLVRVSR